MREIPILFSPPMVRAILEGRKTQTRRLIKPQPTKWHTVKRRPFHCNHVDMPRIWSALSDHSEDRVSPYAVGDRLWVKEGWAPSIAHSHGMDACDCADVNVHYKADGEDRYFRDGDIPEEWTMPKAGPKVTALFMPKWASRIKLEITELRVQRLQEITEDDAKAEGCSPVVVDGFVECGTRKTEFAKLWDSINGKRCPWNNNPWVWCVSFRRLEPRKA